MWKKFFLSLFASLLFAAFSQDAKLQELTIQELSSEIHVILDGLRQQSQALTLQLAIAENELQIQSSKANQLQTDLNALNFCLGDTNKKLASYSQKLSEYEVKLRRRAKMTAWTVAFSALLLLVRVVLTMLNIKWGIKIPYTIALWL